MYNQAIVIEAKCALSDNTQVTLTLRPIAIDVLLSLLIAVRHISFDNLQVDKFGLANLVILVTRLDLVDSKFSNIRGQGYGRYGAKTSIIKTVFCSCHNSDFYALVSQVILRTVVSIKKL